MRGTRSTEISSALQNAHSTAVREITSTNTNIVTRSNIGYQTRSKIIFNNNLYSSELLDNYNLISNELYNIDVEISDRFATNSQIHIDFSLGIHEAIGEMIDSFSTTKVRYSNEELALSTAIYTNDVRVTDMKNRKADANNPVIEGSLLLNSEGNELKLGNKWVLKATTVDTKSSLSFYYDGVEVLPFMALGVNNTETLHGNTTLHAGTKEIFEATDNIAASMKVVGNFTLDQNNYINGLEVDKEYHVYAILEDGKADETAICFNVVYS